MDDELELELMQLLDDIQSLGHEMMGIKVMIDTLAEKLGDE